MANAFVEYGGEKLTVEEYENLTVVEDAGELISEFEITSGPQINDLYMLVFVQLQRIYDLIAFQISKSGNDDGLAQLMELHAAGKFLAPLPQMGEENA